MNVNHWHTQAKRSAASTKSTGMSDIMFKLMETEHTLGILKVIPRTGEENQISIGGGFEIFHTKTRWLGQTT